MKINALSIFALTGGILDCTAYGIPPPKVTWLRLDPAASEALHASKASGLENPPIIELPAAVANYQGLDALWQILAHNNSLKFRPFQASDYNVQIHRGAYVCKASSESGTILSRVVHVKAGRPIINH